MFGRILRTGSPNSENFKNRFARTGANRLNDTTGKIKKEQNGTVRNKGREKERLNVCIEKKSKKARKKEKKHSIEKKMKKEIKKEQNNIEKNVAAVY